MRLFLTMFSGEDRKKKKNSIGAESFASLKAAMLQKRATAGICHLRNRKSARELIPRNWKHIS